MIKEIIYLILVIMIINKIYKSKYNNYNEALYHLQDQIEKIWKYIKSKK